MNPSQLKSFKGMRVLLTGHTGFVGAWMTRWLQTAGASVTGLALAPEEGRASLARDLGLVNSDSSMIGDIRDPGVAEEAFRRARPDLVIHLAAQALVRRSYADPLQTFSTNIMGTANILEAARHASGVRGVVVITTDKVYENREWAWGYRETDALGGHDPYAASKAAAELVVASYRRSFFKEGPILATVRGGNVIGGGDWSEDRLVPDLVGGLTGGIPLVLRNPLAVRPWQHVLDLAHAYLLIGAHMLEGNREVAQAWNVGPGSDGEVSVGELVQRFEEAWRGRSLDASVRPSALHETTLLKLDSSLLRSHLGWRPVLDFPSTLAWTVEWYRAVHQDPGQACALTDAQIDRYVGLLMASGARA